MKIKREWSKEYLFRLVFLKQKGWTNEKNENMKKKGVIKLELGNYSKFNEYVDTLQIHQKKFRHFIPIFKTCSVPCVTTLTYFIPILKTYSRHLRHNNYFYTFFKKRTFDLNRGSKTFFKLNAVFYNWSFHIGSFRHCARVPNMAETKDRIKESHKYPFFKQ